MLRYPDTLRKRAAYRRMLELDDTEARFRAIYKGGLWHSRESGSGQGSEKRYTETLRGWLPAVVKRHNIRSILDGACGDFNWMRLVLPELDVDYSGFDIDRPTIERNISRYGSDRIHFAAANICRDPLPSCDLLIVRDCLFHLSTEDIGRFLENAAQTEYRLLLTSTHTVDEGFKNTDIQSGDFRILDLFSPPFNFPKSAVIDRVKDFPEGYPIERDMILLKKADVPVTLGSGPSGPSAA
ncbi:class I SAM-dependent methyltransferase [Ovoidimarina sediminis]|uniref:class I SAM-dependent methyltransferase n=1 Tax=Ovoidimarina sediminis TaxID=3079856 RepID=UPI00292D8D17|nr:class I SAM-dependent methyltransferase [Rhodophyticola sp. MJ-SS7]